jgi:hypothetical protein
MAANDRPVPEFGRCDSGKQLHGSRQRADQLARQYEMKYGFVMDVYQCDDCNWFHLSRRKHWGVPVISFDWLKRQRRKH